VNFVKKNYDDVYVEDHIKLAGFAKC